MSVPRKFWPLMMLACAPNGVLSPVQMQKALFLMGEQDKEHVGDDFYDFAPHNYGPFSSDICRDIDALGVEGMAARVPSHSPNWSSYGLTDAGKEEGERALESLDPESAAYLREVVDWIVRQDFPDLLRAIYAAYPRYAVKSVFRERS